MSAGKRFIVVFIAIIASIAAAPGRGFGWGKTWMGASLEQIVQAARSKLGPFRYNATFQLGNAGYDSDVYFGNSQKPVPDYSFTAGPIVNVFLPLAKGIVLNVSESPEYVFFLETEKERAWNNRFRGQIHFSLGALYFQAGGGSANIKDRSSTELYLNIRHREDDYGGFAFWQIGKATSIVLRYRHAEYSYENPDLDGINISAALNRREDFVNLTGYLFQVSKARIFVDAEYGRYAPKGELSIFRDARGYSFRAGAEFSPLSAGFGQEREKIMGRVSLGYKRFSVPNSPFKDFEGLTGSTGIEARLFRWTTLRLGFMRDVQFSAYGDLGYYLQAAYGGGIVQSVARNVQLTYDLSLGRNDYVERAGSLSGSARQDKFWTHLLGLGIQLGRDLRLSLTANISRRSLNRDERIANRSSLGLSVTYGTVGGLPMPGSGPSR
jgi:hypothetical protein